MKLLKQIRWALGKSKLEQNLARYCAIEYREADRSWAFHNSLREHKLKFLGDN
jgi:hypothetical protein